MFTSHFITDVGSIFLKTQDTTHVLEFIPFLHTTTAISAHQYHNLTPTQCCSSAGETNGERGRERQRGSSARGRRERNAQEKNEQLETHTAREEERAGSGRETGGGTVKKWGKPINGESLRDQPG